VKLSRGCLVSIQDGSSFLSKPRPAVVVQCTDCIDLRDSVTLCLLTGDIEPPMPMRPMLAPSASNGLKKPSCVQSDKVVTVPKSAISEPWGRVSTTDLKNISAALAF
jgi:mRNA interferase MazF